MYIYIDIYIYTHIYIYIYIYIAIMKTICPPGCHRNGFVATHALGQPYIMCKSISVATKSLR